MIETGLIAFKFLGSGVLGWTLSKFCDQSVLVGKTELQKRLKNKRLDPNHDIERAVLTAHYKALQFIIEHAFSQEDDNRVETYSSRLKTVRDIKFPEIFKSIQEPELDNLPSALVENWQIVIPTSFEPAASLNDVHKSMPEAYLKQAEADLLKLAGWSDVEEQALKQWIAEPEFGWVPSFSACLREQIKINDDFRNIFFATNQQHQMESLARIQAQLKTRLAPNRALASAMSRVEVFLKEFREENREAHATTHNEIRELKALITSLIGDDYHRTEIGEFYPSALAEILIENETPHSLWKEEIVTALTRYVEGKSQLEKKTNLPDYLETKRAEALELYEQAKLDEGEDILRELVETVTLEKLESAARDHAGLLIDQVPFVLAKLDYSRALDLYEQAANAILSVDKRQAINWLWNAGDLASERGELFGEGYLKQARAFYLSAITQCCDRASDPLPYHIDQWAGLQNNLGNVYGVMGERGNIEALGKAVTAYEAALTIRTQDAAPMKWAMTQNNLGIVYQVMGQRGEKEALRKAVTAYEAALTVYTQDAAPMGWAMTQNNLGDIYRVMGERGDTEALGKAVTASEAALTILTQDAAPMKWAGTQNNLGNVYQVMGERGDTEALGKAVTAYEAAVTVYTQDAAPMQWATTQHNLGNVYQVMGERGDTEALGKAVTASEAALTIRTQDAAPMKWAMTQNNLANVYQLMGKRGDTEALGKAVTAYEAALTVCTQDAAPMLWAKSVENLAAAYLFQNKRKQSDTLSILVLKYYQVNDDESFKKALVRILGRRSFLKRLGFLKSYLFS